MINCKREGSVKLCIQDGESELWLTAFTNKIEHLLENTTATISSTVDEIEDALMGLKDIKLKYNCQKNCQRNPGQLNCAKKNRPEEMNRSVEKVHTSFNTWIQRKQCQKCVILSYRTNCHTFQYTRVQ